MPRRTRKRFYCAAAVLGLIAAGWFCRAQSTARRALPPNATIPNWKVDPAFQKDVFTFVRIRYQRGPLAGGGTWNTDFPDSDLNFSYRLQQVTSLKVDPKGRVLSLRDPDLFRYPWIYMVEPGTLYFDETDAAILRRYLLNGGFLMVDDFWGEAEWQNFYVNIKRVFPDREPQELPLSHPLYHCVFDIQSKGQIPSIDVARANRTTGITWERPDAKQVHHRVIFDDKGRIMVFIAHNTDNGDGWEREGEDEWYFHNFSEKIAYPLGINVVFYAMTH